MPGAGTGTSVLSSQGDLRVFGVSASAVLAPESSRIGPYFLVGGGLQRIHASGVTNPYGPTGAVHAGMGLQVPFGQRLLHVEVTPQVMLTDFATGEEWTASVFWPVSIGLSF